MLLRNHRICGSDIVRFDFESKSATFRGINLQPVWKDPLLPLNTHNSVLGL